MDTKLALIKQHVAFLYGFRDRIKDVTDAEYATLQEDTIISILEEWIKDQERAISSVREEESTEEVLNA